MINGSKQFSFTLESCDAVCILRKLLGQYLDCHFPPKLLILGLVNFPHAAFAELAGDLIMSQRIPDHEECLLHADSQCNAFDFRL